jgi:hypothetical protein
MIRSYGTWCRTAERPVDLTIHVIDQTVHFEITSGRMDVLTLLTAADVRFWTEVATEPRDGYAGSWDVEPMSCLSDTRIHDVATALGFRGNAWQWRVEPSVEPAPAYGGWLPADETSRLADSGVLDGSTVSFRASPEKGTK